MPFELVTSTDSVDLWSDDRIPFDPKEDLREMRDALHAEIRALSGPRLNAWLAGPKGTGADVENLLFSNVGRSAFTECCQEAVRFERRFTVGASPSRRIWKWHHHYGLSEEAPAWAPIGEGTDVHMEGKGDLPNRPETLWAEAHRGRGALVPTARDKPLILTVRVRSPGPLNLVHVLKLLNDSICCSFHSYIGALQPEVARRAADICGEDEETVIQWLARDGPLGPARFVWPYGSRLQWSPEDDRIVAVEISGTATGKARWIVDATLSEAKPR